MQSQRFLAAFLAGLFPALGAGVAVFLVLILAGLLDDQALLRAAAAGSPFLLFTGAGLLGALCGVAASARTGTRAMASGAGAAAAAAGMLAVLLLAATGGSIMEALATESASFEVEPQSPLPWSGFHKGLLFLLPAAAAAALAALGPHLTANQRASTLAGPPAYAGAEGFGTGVIRDRTMKCPKCASFVMVPAGQLPYCQSCGFGS